MNILKKTINFLVNETNHEELEKYYNDIFKDNFASNFYELFKQDAYQWMEKVWNNNPSKKEEMKKMIISHELIKRLAFEGYPPNFVLNNFSLKNNLIINDYLFKEKNKDQIKEIILSLLNKVEDKNWTNFDKEKEIAKKFIEDIEIFSKLKPKELSDIYCSYLKENNISFQKAHMIDLNFYDYLVEKYDINSARKLLINKYLYIDKMYDYLPVLIKNWQKTSYNDNVNFFNNFSNKMMHFEEELGTCNFSSGHIKKGQVKEIMNFFESTDYLQKVIKDKIEDMDYRKNIINWINYIAQNHLEYFKEIVLTNQKEIQKNIYYFFDSKNVLSVFNELKNNWDLSNLKENANFFIFLNKFIHHPEYQEIQNENYYVTKFYQGDICTHHQVFKDIQSQAKIIMAEFKEKWLGNLNISDKEFVKICINKENLEKFLLENNITLSNKKNKLSVL